MKFLKHLMQSFIIGIFLTAIIIVLSIGQNLSIPRILSKIIIFVGKGLSNVIFTPYLWIAILLLIFLMKPDGLINLAKKLSETFEELWGIKFRNPSPEQPVSAGTITDTIQSSRPAQRSDRTDVNFYKELLSRESGTMAICRFLLYAIDQPGRPPNFSLRQLVEWTFGREALQAMINQNALHSIAYPASLLVQVGALEGSFNISHQNGETTFESARVSRSAHQALEELAREGYQMTPQVHID